jgi:hypothetical protein
MGIKQPEFDASLESVENFAYILCEKSYQQKSDEKIEFLLLSLFLVYNFCGEHLFHGIKISIKFCVFTIQYWILQKN